MPDEGQPGSAQQIPGAPSTVGLQGTVLDGPAVSHPHVPSTLTYMSLHEIPPPPLEEAPPELLPELEPEPEPEDEAPPLDAAPPELPPEDPDEELTDTSGGPPSTTQEPPSESHEKLPLLPEHPDGMASANDTEPAERI